MVNEAVDSPRTSAGISKSLLTPIRRLGLSRKRRTPGLSPLFSTPQMQVLTSTPNSASQQTASEDDETTSPNMYILVDGTTPARKLGLHRRQNKKKYTKRYDSPTSQKSESPLHSPKTVMESDGIVEEDLDPKVSSQYEALDDVVANTKCLAVENKTENYKKSKLSCGSPVTPEKNCIVIPNRKGSKTKTPKRDAVVPLRKNYKQKNSKGPRKGTSGDFDLKRKCIIVIDKHILRQRTETSPTNMASNKKPCEIRDKLAQDEKVEHYSDHDDLPLSEISKTLNIIEEKDKKSLHKRSRECVDDLDYIKQKSPKEMKLPATKVAKLEKCNTKTSASKNIGLKTEECKIQIQKILPLTDSEDDDFESKKTILVRKAYPKPLNRAKSTGSITQKDIEDIKARIKNKKNALIINSRGHNISELMDLIKKWRRGCQVALMELLDIMKRKIPEKQNMKNGELLKMLNIPLELVDYNEEDDCFLTPEN